MFSDNVRLKSVESDKGNLNESDGSNDASIKEGKIIYMNISFIFSVESNLQLESINSQRKIVNIIIHLPQDHLRTVTVKALEDWTLLDVFNKIKQKIAISPANQLVNKYLFFVWNNKQVNLGMIESQSPEGFEPTRIFSIDTDFNDPDVSTSAYGSGNLYLISIFIFL